MSDKVFGFDLNKFSADEIVNKMRLTELGITELLHGFLEVQENIEFERSHLRGNFYVEKALLEASPYAFELYRRLYKGKKEQILAHQSLKSESHPPDTLRFWSHPVAIDILFRTLIKDDFYELAEEEKDTKLK